jgi:hypothetical protein
MRSDVGQDRFGIAKSKFRLVCDCNIAIWGWGVGDANADYSVPNHGGVPTYAGRNFAGVRKCDIGAQHSAVFLHSIFMHNTGRARESVSSLFIKRKVQDVVNKFCVACTRNTDRLPNAVMAWTLIFSHNSLFIVPITGIQGCALRQNAVMDLLFRKELAALWRQFSPRDRSRKAHGMEI